jgi:hypothetical protein
LRAIGIDPKEKRVVVKDVDPTPGELRRLCGGSPRVVATFPNQDVLLAREDARSGAGFSIGGSTAIHSPAFVIGRLDGFRARTAARSTVERLSELVRWLEPEPSAEEHQPDETIKVILIDPEAGSIDHVEIRRSIAAIATLVGGEATPLMTVPGDDIVYGKSHAPGWRWRKDDCEFNGRSVIAGSDWTNSLMDPVASVEILRRTVEFGHRNVWIGYCEHPARRSALVRKSPEPNAGSAERYIPEG